MTVPEQFIGWVCNHAEDVMEHAKEMQQEGDRFLPGPDAEGSSEEAELRSQFHRLERLARNIRRTAKKLPTS